MDLTERIKQYLSITGDGARLSQLRDSLAEPGPAIMVALAELGDDVIQGDHGRWYLVNPYVPSAAAVAELNAPEIVEPEPVIEPEPQPEPVVGKSETFDLMVAELAEIAEELKAEIPVVKAPEMTTVPVSHLSVYEMADKLIKKYGSGKYPGMRKNPSKPVEKPVMTEFENPIMTALKKAVGADKKPISQESHILSLEMWQVLREWLMHTYSDPELSGVIQWPLTPAQLTERHWRGKTVRSQTRDTIRAIRGMNRWGNKDDRALLKATIANLDNVLEQPAAPPATPAKEVKPVKPAKAAKVVKAKAPSRLIELLEMTRDDVVVEDVVVDADFTPPLSNEMVIAGDLNAVRDRINYCNKISAVKSDVWMEVCRELDTLLGEFGLNDAGALRTELKAMAEFFDVARTA